MRVEIDADELCELRKENERLKTSEYSARLALNSYSQKCWNLKAENESLKKRMPLENVNWVSNISWKGLVKERDWWRERAFRVAALLDDERHELSMRYAGVSCPALSVAVSNLEEKAVELGYEVPE